MTPEASGGQFPWRTQRSAVPSIAGTSGISSSTPSVENGVRTADETQTHASKHDVGGQHGADASPVPLIRALKTPRLSCRNGATKAECHQPPGLGVCGLRLEKRFFQRPEPVEGLARVRALLPPGFFLGAGKGRQKIRKRPWPRMFQVHAQRIHAISDGQCGVPGTVAHRPSGS